MVVSNIQLRVNSTQAVKALNSANTAAAKLNATLQKSQGAMKSTQGTLRGMGSAGFGAAKGLNAGSIAAKGFGVALKTALGPISLLLSGIGGVTAAFSTLAQQDFAEAKVRSLGVNSEKLTKQLSGVSRELAGQASVTELTSAAYDVASAGFTDAAAAANILKAASQGATGGFSDINTVGDATTSVLNAYGLEADKAAKLVDGFIQTQNDGKIVIGEYAANIAKVAPVAAALGVPLEEVNAAVAQITAGGQGAEVTFTALKTAFAQVAAGKVGDEFKKFGVEISASTLKSEGLAGTLEKIKKSGADAGTIIKAFGTEAGPSILALLNDTEKYNKLLENQKNSQGAAAAAAFEASDTINGSLKRLQTAFTNLFADGSELGLLLKSTFKVAAVTVETLTAAVKLTLAPFRAIFAAVGEIGSAISQALGMEGVNVAFELEQGFQRFLGVLQTITHVAVGVGKAIGQVIGGAIGAVMKATEGLRTAILEGIGGLIMTIPRLLGRMFDMLPDFAKNLIKRVLGGGKQLLMDAAALGAGVMAPVTGPQTDAANAIQQTGKLPKPKTPTKKSDLEKQREAAAALLVQLKRKAQLESASTDAARRQLELDFAKADLATRFPLLKEEELKKLRDQLDSNFAITEEKRKQKALDDAAKKAAEELAERYKKLGDAIKSEVGGAIKGLINGTKTLGETALGIVNKLKDRFIDLAINAAFAGLGAASPAGSIFANLFGGGRANGGTVQGGRSYMVGERGPELFTPGRTGSIAPNSALGGNMSVVVNVDASGTEVQGNQGNADQLGRLIGQAVQAELIKQKRPGGLLTR